MKFKVTFFNPQNYNVRNYFYNFVWDGINHGWRDKKTGLIYKCNIESLVNKWTDYLRMDGEYITIRKIKEA